MSTKIPLASIEECEDNLAEIRSLTRRRDTLIAAHNETLASVNAAHNALLVFDGVTFDDRIQQLTDEIADYCDRHRKTLVGDDDKKTYELKNGVVKWRKQPAKARKLAGVNALEYLQERYELQNKINRLVASLKLAGVVDLVVKINTGPARGAFEKQTVDAATLEALGLEYVESCEMISVEPAKFTREGE